MEAGPTRTAPWDYPAEDDVAETLLHLLIRTGLLALVRRWLEARGIQALSGSDQFVYWVRGNPKKSLAPDLYVVFGVEPSDDVRVWKTWEEGVTPQLAVEVVSDDVEKDYVLAPMRYAEMGVDELIVFDPLDGSDRVRWQIYRRNDAGDLVEVEVSDGDRAWCESLDCWLRYVDAGNGPRLRIATGPDGSELFPTAEEAERAATQAERLAKEDERARRLELEAEVAELRRRLAERE